MSRTFLIIWLTWKRLFFFLCFIASDFGVNLITNSQLNSWLKFAWTDLRQFPICLCYILWGMIFRRHSKNFKYTPDGPNIRVFGTIWDWITRHPPPTPPHGGIDHRIFSTYIYIKIEIKLQKMIHSFEKKKNSSKLPVVVGGGGYICSPYLLRIYLKLKFIALFFPFTAKVFVSRAFSDTQHRYILNEQ